MNRLARLLPGLLVLAGLAAPATAKSPALPHVKFAGWTVYSPGAAAKMVKPGGTLNGCRTPTELLARGPVRGAIRHQHYLETWSRNGKRTDRYTIFWFGKGTYPDSWSVTKNAGFRNGTWTIKLTRKGKLIGRESLKLSCS